MLLFPRENKTFLNRFKVGTIFAPPQVFKILNKINLLHWIQFSTETFACSVIRNLFSTVVRKFVKIGIDSSQSMHIELHDEQKLTSA